MKMKEDEKQNSVSEPTSPIVLSKGRWDKNISWEFMISPEKPDSSFCTAVCCVTTFNQKLILVRNKNKWELPSGIIENGEKEEQAAIREVGEETGAFINNPQMFGYRKLTAQKPVEKPEKQGMYYPFPHSYVIYFHADTSQILERPHDEEIIEVKIVNFNEAVNLLTTESQYAGILDYMVENRLIDVI